MPKPKTDMSKPQTAETSRQKRTRERQQDAVRRTKRLAAKLAEIRSRQSTIEAHFQECSRLHLRTLELPCGRHEACFGNPRCPQLPQGAQRPWMSF